MKRRTLLLAGGLLLVLAAGFLIYRRSARTGAPGDIIIRAIQGDTGTVASRTLRRTNRQSSAFALDSSRLSQLVRDTNWEVRLNAAAAVAQKKDLPERRRAELLLDALAQEIATPTATPPLTGSYLSRTGVNRLHYVHLIEDLGPAAAGPARAATQKERGARREWAAIAWGASGAKEAAPELRQLLRSSSQSDVRMSAAYFLGRLGDKAAIGDLKAALADPATAQIMVDDTGDRGRILYPVREQAAGALMALGLKVERNGHTFTAN